jgi:hypothetical protein
MQRPRILPAKLIALILLTIRIIVICRLMEHVEVKGSGKFVVVTTFATNVRILRGPFAVSPTVFGSHAESHLRLSK